MTTKARPTLDRNGSDPVVLEGYFRMARNSTASAIESVGWTRPNGRDYATTDDLRVAIAEHDERMTKLRIVAEDLAELLAHAQGARR